MRTLNGRFAAGLILFLALVGAGVYFLHNYQLTRIAADVRVQIDDARAAGRTDDAIGLAYQYLDFCPNDVEMMVDLAGWLEQSASSRKQRICIASLLNRALQIDTKRADLRRRVVGLDLKLGDWGECLDHLERLLAETPDDVELLANMGVCQEAIGHPHDAAASFEKALKLDPKRTAASLDYSSLLNRHLQRPDDAKRVLDEAIGLSPDNAELRLGLARLLQSTGKLTEAAASAKEAVRLAPQNLAAITAAAEIEQAAGHFGPARLYYQQARQVAPNNPQYACSLAWLLLCEGKTEQATAELEAALKEKPDHADALTLLGDILAMDGRIDALEKVVADLDKLRLADSAYSWNADYLRARLLMRRSDFATAAARLEELRIAAAKRPPLAKQANYLLAQCYEQLHDGPHELEAYRRVFDADPLAGFFRLEYAGALARGGDFAAATTELRAAIQRPDLLPRAVIEITGDIADRGRRLGGAAAIQELERALEPIRATDANAHAVLAKVELLRRSLRTADALKLIDQYIARHPNQAEAIALRVRLLHESVGPERASAELAEAEKRLGDNVEFRIARIRMLASRPGVAPQAVLSLGSDIEKFNSEDKGRILHELVRAAGAIGDPKVANQAMNQLRQARPDDIAVRFGLAIAAITIGNEATLAGLRGEIVAAEGTNGRTNRLIEVARLLKAGDARAALNQVDQIAKPQACDPLASYLRGRAEEAMDNAAAARQSYAAALDAGLLDQPVAKLFAMLAAGDPGKRVTLLEDSPLFDRLRLDVDGSAIRTLLPVAPASVRTSLAVRLLRGNGYAAAPELVWLGRLLQEAGINRVAEATLARATEIAPLSDEAWSARLAYHATRQDAGKLQELVVQAKRVLPAERAAIALIAAGLAKEAPKVVQPALARATVVDRNGVQQLLQSGRLIEARTQLQSLIDASETSNDDRIWARRALAMSLTIEPSLAAFQKSLTLLSANPGTDDDRRIIATVYAAQRTRLLAANITARAEARRRLAEIQSPRTDDLILRARLAHADGDLAEYGQIVARLKSTFTKDPATAAFLAREAIRGGEERIKSNVAVMRDDVGEPMLSPLTAWLKIANGKSGEVAQQLEQTIARQSNSVRQAAESVRCGHLCFELLHAWPIVDAGAAIALRDASIKWYRTGLGRDPQALLHLVTLQSEAGRMGDALELLQNKSVREHFSVEALAAAYVTALRRGSPTPAQMQAVERYLDGLIREAPGSSALQLALADFYEQTRRSPQAEAIYRAVLAHEPDNLVAANNLAWTAVANPARMSDALRLISETIDRHGPLDDLLDTRGRLLVAAGRTDEGLRDLLEAADASPNAARFVQLAVVYRQVGRAPEASRAMTEAKRYGLIAADVPPQDADAVRELTKN